ncbi:hypothetical protein A6R68_10760 [Neotoma lepida]|uniref:High mobility group protein HMG-I/HMG-Y n=1 Tax=Neotoma lepida TaxID=56216 RepID=A0A1A6FX17_NEOLE|nr:hypothetical protein A6R68_10760 [Neotoma lepida]
MAPPPGDTAGAGGPVPPAPGSLFLSSPEPGLRSSNWDSESGLFLVLARLQEGRRKMSESSSKSSQPLASKQEKDGTEKRGRGRPRKQPPKEPSEVPTPKRPRGRPKGSKNKGATKTREKEEEGGISQESSEEEQ